MVQEELQNRQNPEAITDDGAFLDSEVGNKVDDTSVEVLRTVEGPNFLRRILGYLDTEQAGAEVARLDQLRAANDNN